MMQGFERDQVSKSGRIFLAIKPDNLADVKGGGDSARRWQLPIVIVVTAKTYAGHTRGIDSSMFGLRNTSLGEKPRSPFSSKMDYQGCLVSRERAKWSKRSRRVEGDPRSIVGDRTFVAATSGTSRSVAGRQKRTGTPVLEKGIGRKGGRKPRCMYTEIYTATTYSMT